MRGQCKVGGEQTRIREYYFWQGVTWNIEKKAETVEKHRESGFLSRHVTSSSSLYFLESVFHL
jgi:hypothetical protein